MSDGSLYFLDVESSKQLFTVDGGRYFNTCEELLNYISDKCGKDVADCFKLEGVDKLYSILEEHSAIDYFDIIEGYKLKKETGKFKSPVSEMKCLRECFKKFEELFKLYYEIYNNFY